MIKIAIAGATGYTGSELLRILHNHPEVEVVRITSEQHAGASITEVFPSLRGYYDLTFESLQAESLGTDTDLVFLALPHTKSMEVVPQIRKHQVRCIDLSADFRLHHPDLYPTWYHVKHAAPDLLKETVYGLPELKRREISAAPFVANPGCYPTAALLGIAPLLKNKGIELKGIVIDAKSGVTGAGKSPKPHLHFPEANEALMAYRIADHQHTPEIEQEISELVGETVTINFTPHLIPMNRGVLNTIYADLKEKTSTDEVLDLYEDFYRTEPFVRVLPSGEFPNTKFVRGTNLCDIGLKVDPRTGKVIVVSAIDNLVKGAAGQAVQNMNLMLGFDETTGLHSPPLSP